MKKFIYLLVLTMPFTLQAQKLITGNNIFKTNLSSIALKNYSFTYERLVYNKMSFAVSYRFMPKDHLPVENAITDFIDNKNVNLGRFQMSNWALTPEVRFYSHKRMRGFYMAPYARIASFDVSLPVTYNQTGSGGKQEKSDADFAGSIRSVSGGLLLGVQQQLFKKIVLDIWLIGAHYGSSTGTLTAKYNSLNAADVKSLQNAIDNIDASPFVVKGTAYSDYAVLSTDGPWAGIRAVGINIGFRF